MGIGTAGVSSYFYTGVSGGDVSLPIGLSVPYPSLDLNFQNMTTMDSRVTFSRASSATYFDSSGVLQTAGNNVARFDHNPTTLAPLGLLIEEQRTNSIRNNTMVGAVAGTPGTNPTNWISGTTIDNLTKEIVGTGTTNGINYIDIRLSGTSSTGGNSTIAAFETQTQIAALNTQTWTVSAWVAVVGGSTTNVDSLTLGVRFNDSGGTQLTTGTTSLLGTTSALTRIAVTATANNASTAFVNGAIVANFTNSSSVDITLRIGLPQLELGAFATSVIPTTNAAATRNADVASMTGTNFSSWYRADEGTLYVEAFSYQTTSGPNGFASIEDGTTSNRIQIRRAGQTGVVTDANIIVANGTVQATFTGTANSWPVNTFAKTTLAYKINDVATTLNAGTVQTDTSALIPVVDRMIIGGGAGIQEAKGCIRKIAFYPTRLSNEQLQALTR